jgi:hypothetical protein
MIFSAIQNIMVNAGSIELITTKLGFPQYMIAFIGWAKLVGAIAILVPGFPRIKEWAYAGLFFDLTGAMFASIMVEGFVAGAFMMVFVVFHLASYFLYHKMMKESGRPVVS